MDTAAPVYTEQIAKIRNVKLGWEDHGIFTCQLDLDYGGSGQGAGGFCLDEPRHDAAGDFIGRFGTAFGMEWVIRLMRACNANDFSEVKGTTLIALREPDDYHGKVIGLKPLPTEKGQEFIFGDMSLEFDLEG